MMAQSPFDDLQQLQNYLLFFACEIKLSHRSLHIVDLGHQNLYFVPNFSDFNCSLIRACWISRIHLHHWSYSTINLYCWNMFPFKQLHWSGKLFSSCKLDQRNQSPPSISNQGWFRSLNVAMPTKLCVSGHLFILCACSPFPHHHSCSRALWTVDISDCEKQDFNFSWPNY